MKILQKIIIAAFEITATFAQIVVMNIKHGEKHAQNPCNNLVNNNIFFFFFSFMYQDLSFSVLEVCLYHRYTKILVLKL